MKCTDCGELTPALFTNGKCWPCEIKRPEFDKPEHWLDSRPADAKR